MLLASKRPAMKQRYELGPELTLALSVGGSVQLVCARNPFGLEEIRLGWAPDNVPFADRMTVHLMLDDQEGWRGSTLLRKCHGYFIQVAYTSAAVIATWNLQGDNANLRLCVTADRDTIIRGYKELVMRGPFACQLRDWNALTAMPAGVLRDHLKRTLWPILATPGEK